MNTRRSFLAGGLAAAGSLLTPPQKQKKASPDQTSPPMVKPRVLREGDTVGLVAPSSYVFDVWKIDEAAARIEALGLKAKLGKHVRGRRGYLSGTEEERLEDFHAMFSDSKVAGVFCLTGGYGSPRLLDRLDYALIRRNPKVFLGYSDITGFHLALGKKAGLVTFHGPNAVSSLKQWTREQLERALFVPEPIGEVAVPPEEDPLSPEFPLRTVSPGRARGRTVGGNLTLVSATMGTPYEIETKGRILLLEDIGEAPYRIDRMLVQLKLAGKLGEAAGIVFGTCTDCTPAQSNFEINLSLSELLEDLLGGLNKPVLAGLVFGHTKEKATIPLGVEAELDADAKKLTILEAATVGEAPA
jgi:muramoyltetrapeptide carboxypeptidase